MEELPWTEEEEESAEHPYYNNIPGKMPPPGGFIDTRLTNQNADGCQVQLSLTLCFLCKQTYTNWLAIFNVSSCVLIYGEENRRI